MTVFKNVIRVGYTYIYNCSYRNIFGHRQCIFAFKVYNQGSCQCTNVCPLHTRTEKDTLNFCLEDPTGRTKKIVALCFFLSPNLFLTVLKCGHVNYLYHIFYLTLLLTSTHSPKLHEVQRTIHTSVQTQTHQQHTNT